MFRGLRLSTLVLLSAVAFAQNRGTISGYVKDSSGGMVTTARVTLSNERTGEVRNATSDTTGSYQFLGLISGSYVIEAEVPMRSPLPAVNFPAISRSFCPPANW